MYWVYILRIRRTGRYYVGQTQDIAKRLDKHSRGETKSLKNRGEFELVYTEECSSRAEAMRREKEIKKYKGGVAFKKLLSEFDERKATTAGLAEVPPEAG
jgi:putative endonuclease